MSYEWRGYKTDPENGVVYGLRGKPITRKASDGYIVIVNHGRSVAAAHRAIWESVHGEIPAGMQVNHKNGIKHDNRISNLEVCSCLENVRHAYRTGLNRTYGERHPHAKLTEAQVLEIRRSKETHVRLARIFGVCWKTIRAARLGITWKRTLEGLE